MSAIWRVAIGELVPHLRLGDEQVTQTTKQPTPHSLQLFGSLRELGPCVSSTLAMITCRILTAADRAVFQLGLTSPGAPLPSSPKWTPDRLLQLLETTCTHSGRHLPLTSATQSHQVWNASPAGATLRSRLDPIDETARQVRRYELQKSIACGLYSGPAGQGEDSSSVTLLADIDQAIDEALWRARRAIEERAPSGRTRQGCWST